MGMHWIAILQVIRLKLVSCAFWFWCFVNILLFDFSPLLCNIYYSGTLSVRLQHSGDTQTTNALKAPATRRELSSDMKTLSTQRNYEYIKSAKPVNPSEHTNRNECFIFCSFSFFYDFKRKLSKIEISDFNIYPHAHKAVSSTEFY